MGPSRRLRFQPDPSTNSGGSDPLEMILNGLVEGVVAVNLDERVIHINAAAGRLLGVSPQESLDHPITELTEIRALPDTVHRALETCCEISSEATIEMPANDRDRVLEFDASPVRNAAGEVTGAVLSIHDITELRLLEKVRRDFVANVSHELKTPITAIRGLVETILTDPEMKKQTERRFLEKVHSQALQLSTLVTDLLTLARLESSDAILEPTPFDLREAILTSIRTRRSTGEKTATVEHTLPPTPVIIRGDSDSLRLVASNLLDNALKYTPVAGQIWVRLFTEDGQAIFEVEDNGMGIAPKDRERIFERFYRVDKARSRELGGTGLGLSIVKHVCLAHGGLVDVKSEPGRGSTFRITLPLDSGFSSR